MLARGAPYQKALGQSANVEVAAHADHVSLACRWRDSENAMVIAPRLGNG